jgi:hypothetical protein
MKDHAAARLTVAVLKVNSDDAESPLTFAVYKVTADQTADELAVALVARDAPRRSTRFLASGPAPATAAGRGR